MKETSEHGEEAELLLKVKKTNIMVVGAELDQPLQVHQGEVEQGDTLNFPGHVG